MVYEIKQINDGWRQEVDQVQQQEEGERRGSTAGNFAESRAVDELGGDLEAANGPPSQAAQEGLELEDISDDEDYQTFKQRKSTIKKNLGRMAVVSYEKEPERKKAVLDNIERALASEEQIYI